MDFAARIARLRSTFFPERMLQKYIFAKHKAHFTCKMLLSIFPNCRAVGFRASGLIPIAEQQDFAPPVSSVIRHLMAYQRYAHSAAAIYAQESVPSAKLVTKKPSTQRHHTSGTQKLGTRGKYPYINYIQKKHALFSTHCFFFHK